MPAVPIAGSQMVLGRRAAMVSSHSYAHICSFLLIDFYRQCSVSFIATNYRNCSPLTASFVPFGLSSMEGNGRASPDYSYSTIPDSMMSASRLIGPHSPNKGRLQMAGSDAAWCAPSSANTPDYLQVTLLSLSLHTSVSTNHFI